MTVIRPVADFSFENLDGKNVTLNDTDGKVRLFYFFFSSCPDVCPVTTLHLSKVQDLLKEQGVFGSKASIVSITFDPDRDTPEKLKEFGDKFKADYTGWYFLRGDQQQVIDLATKSFGILVLKDNDNNFSHADLIGLVDKKGNLRKIYRPEETIETIAADVKTLTKE